MLEVGPRRARPRCRPPPRLPHHLSGAGPDVDLGGAPGLAGLDVDVVEEPFEGWHPSGAPFDLVCAATAWHTTRSASACSRGAGPTTGPRSGRARCLTG